MASKKLDVIFSDSNGANEKRKRLTFERPDIAHVRGEICRRFDVDLREMSIQARVTVRGSQKEYAVSSSDDLVDLWEEIEEIYVVVPVARMTLEPTRLVVIFNNDETRRITFESKDFNEITEKIRELFNAETCSLVGTIKGDETKYSIKSNEDVNELWSDIEKIYVTGKTKRLEVDTKVLMENDQYIYHIDQKPDANSKLVKEFRSDLDVEAIMEADACFKRMGDLTNIMYYAAVGTGNLDMQVKTKDIGFKIIEICHSADNTFGSYILACSEVNEMFHKAVQYLLEDDHKRALRVIASLAGTAERCKEKTEALIRLTDETMKDSLLSPETDLILRAEMLAATEQYEESERTLAVVREEWKKLLSQSGGNRPTLANECADATLFSRLAELGAVAATVAPLLGYDLPVRAAPTFLLAAVTIGLVAGIIAGENINDARAKRRLEEKCRTDEAKRKRRLELRTLLDQASKCWENAKTQEKSRHVMSGELTCMKTSLLKMKAFFKELSSFCLTIQSSEEGTMKEIAEDTDPDSKVGSKLLLESRGFKLGLLYYQAKWVALKSVCTECRQTLRETNKELHKRIEENPTKQEAKAALDGMIQDLKKTLHDDVTVPSSNGSESATACSSELAEPN